MIKVIVALDFANAESALEFVKTLDNSICRLKVGKELFTSAGPEFVRQLHDLGFDVFLDLKFHDIPATTAKAVASAAELGVWMVNVHASGGEEMMRAAVEALKPYGAHAPKLIAVTVLTSMSAPQLEAVGVSHALPAQVLNLAEMAKRCGLDGVVCSAKEAPILRSSLGNDFLLVTPGIRPAGSAYYDQKRVMTPEDAIEAGVSYLVMGRPIREADNPNAILHKIQQLFH